MTRSFPGFSRLAFAVCTLASLLAGDVTWGQVSPPAPRANNIPRDDGTYQNGGYWATPLAWLMVTVMREDPARAARLFCAAVEDFQARRDINEWVNDHAPKTRGVRDYCASAAMPLAGARRLRAHLAEAGKQLPPALAQRLDAAEAWLKTQAKRVLRGSSRVGKGGVRIFTPDATGGYGAFWVRDWSYSVEGCPDVFSPAELRDGYLFLAAAQRADGCMPDRVAADGHGIYSPGGEKNPFSANGSVDQSPFMVILCHQYWKRYADLQPFQKTAAALEKALHFAPRNRANGLVHITDAKLFRPYSFLDTVPLVGDQQFDSVLFWDACHKLAEMFDAAGQPSRAAPWRREADRVKAALASLWDDQQGLFVAASIHWRQPSIWGSVFAVYAGLATPEQARRITRYCLDHEEQFVFRGQLRHLPKGTFWGQPEAPWSIEQSRASWTQAQASGNKIAITSVLSLNGGDAGQWTSQWHKWPRTVDAAEVAVRAAVSQFAKQTIQVVVKGSETPYTDASGVPHTWYGRCMIAIVDQNRWIMALRSGISHIAWNTPRKRDTIHLLTSSDEGRTWNKLDRWFDAAPMQGMPYEDGETHSEPGLYRMPNGDLILQFWRTDYSTGTKQLRSTDHGKTWVTDLDRINVVGVTGAEGNRAIGTEDWFVDPEHPAHVYMAFEYFLYNDKAGSLLAKSTDNGKSYTFLSWMSPLGDGKNPASVATFEPAVEYVGNRTIVAVLRHGGAAAVGSRNRPTWQTISTDMGASFRPIVNISAKINGGLPNGSWQRARLYKESNPCFQHNNPLSYARGEGRLWGFGIHSIDGGYTRKPVVYWSDDNAQSWYGPQLLHGPMYPGTDTGYGDLKRRRDGTFVAATYYCPPDNLDIADVEQYTFGGQRAKMMIEADRDGDGNPDADSGWRELYNGSNVYAVSGLGASHWRLRLHLNSIGPAGSPTIVQVKVSPR